MRLVPEFKARLFHHFQRTIDNNTMAPQSTFSFQLFSDLHLEAPKAYDVFELPAQSPCAALIGDIGCVKDKGLLEFLQLQLERFKLVFFLLGNHEPYHSNWHHATTTIEKFASDMKQLRNTNTALGEFVFLNRTRYDTDDEVTILGCTLYSMIGPTKDDMDRVSMGLNDFYKIDDWTVEQHNEAHIADLAWLNAEVQKIATQEPHRKVVILTHHSPTKDPRGVDPRHANSPISSGFCTDLSEEVCWTSPCVKVWAFGHTHFNCDFGGRPGWQVVTNQRGYYFAQADVYMGDKVIEI